MSHYTVLRTRLTDTPSLLKALADLGFQTVEVHQETRRLYGYRGDLRSDAAEIIVRRAYVGPASNDIGFKKQPDGSFVAIISEHDRQKYSPEWLARLTQRHAYHLAMVKLTEQAFAVVTEETEQNGRIHLLLRRMA